jgi:hypothetical protein
VVATVVVDELDEVDETEDEELDRWRPFRLNMVLRSSVIGEIVWPPLPPHADLLSGKVGGFATAVMGEDGVEATGRGRGPSRAWC